MIAAIALASNKKSSSISLRFARGTHIAILDKEKATFKIVENPFRELSTGAGTQLVPFLKNEYSVNTLIAYELGLKVQQLASAENMKLIIITDKSRTLKQLLKLMDIQWKEEYK